VLVAVTAATLASGVASLATYQGAAPNPSPCASPQDTICGRHLAGTGSFALGAEATSQPVTGTIASTGFRGTGGDVVMPLVLGGTWIHLHAARAELTTIGSDGVVGRLGGGILVTDVESTVKPAIADQARARFAAECTPGGQPPACGCPSGSVGELMRALYDQAPNDCVITDAEVESRLGGFFVPDLDLDGDNVNDAISIGVGVTAVPATFPAP
jgi:hypothetical protein